MTLKEKAIRLAKRALAKQNDGDSENGEEEEDELEGNAPADVEEDQFLSGFGFFPDAIETNEIDSKTDEIEAQGASISEQGGGGSFLEEEIDTAGI